MRPDDLTHLLTPEGMHLLASLPPYDDRGEVLALVTGLREAGHAPELVAAALTQARLRRRGEAKFGPLAHRMLFTEAGLEQATRLRVAAQHAGRVRRAGLASIADLGCGIGGDAMAFAGAGLDVIAVERDEVTAAVAQMNLGPLGATVECASVEDFGVERVAALWFDPARRSVTSGGSRRLANPDDWSPSLRLVFERAGQRPSGIKLSPAFAHELIPSHEIEGGVEAQWVSESGETVELVVWTGALKRPGITRAALVLGRDGDAPAELTGAGAAEDAATRPLGAVLYEPDGAVIRAELIGDLARSLKGGMLSERIAWITADSLSSTPFARAFRVIEEHPIDTAALKRRLRQLDIGTLEIKTRGVDLDPATLRRKLSLRGSRQAVLILTRMAGARRAIIAERADTGSAAPRG